MGAGMETDEEWEDARRQMVERVALHFADTGNTTGLFRMGDRLEAALSTVPRHRFVPPGLVGLAYADSALPIDHGQTISQPFIVALMIELAHLTSDARVLEIGTGSGYEAAVLARMVDDVYTIELVPELAERSAACLAELGFGGIHVRCGDGFEGWPEEAPFDAILVTACSPEVPEPLLQQLAVGGRMVIPVGSPNAYQELRVIEKTGTDDFVVRHGLSVAFVPLVHSEDANGDEGEAS
jgi:protein-L-isoaspartate(D-aspartate) O-methyltransferase